MLCHEKEKVAMLAISFSHAHHVHASYVYKASSKSFRTQREHPPNVFIVIEACTSVLSLGEIAEIGSCEE